MATVEAGFVALALSRGRERVRQPPRLLFMRPETLGEVSVEVLDAYAACRQRLASAEASLTPAPRLELDSAGPAWWARVAELNSVHATLALTSWDRYSPSIQSLLERSAGVSLSAYEESWRTQRRLIDEVDAAMDGHDALLLPANPYPGLCWHEWPGPKVFEWYRFCWPFNITLQPAITIPWSFSADGVPIAYQLVGHRGADERLLDVATWCESRGSFDTRPVTPAYGRSAEARATGDASLLRFRPPLASR
jgi:Asp-tRNA(Asn)/Glu-tRNA(Gln) amidotransferase A subunit family amidase